MVMSKLEYLLKPTDFSFDASIPSSQVFRNEEILIDLIITNSFTESVKAMLRVDFEVPTVAGIAKSTTESSATAD